ncbi:MAG: TolC family protein [Pyrinomonadaceae bacterium]
MFFRQRENAFRRAFSLASMFLIGGLSFNLQAQTEIAVNKINTEKPLVISESEAAKSLVASVLPKYYNLQDGLTPAKLIERALQANGELVAVRIEIEKAKARLRQARLRPNPTLELEQASGRLLGSGGDGELSVGASLPLELYGRRKSRIELAEIEIRAREAEVANFERRVAGEVLLNYGEALAALREIEVLENILELDLQTTRFVQIRVNEGDAAPLELNLLRVEVERLRSKKELAEGRLQAALTKIKLISGMPFEESLQLGELISTAVLPQIPTTIETAVDVALRTRPDIQLAQIEEDLATAGLRLIRANSKPDFTAYTRYSQGRSSFDNTPIGELSSRERALTFGVSIGIPVFNKNQGAKAEAELSIKQAQARRDFAEKVVRSEIVIAFQKYEAARRALVTLETGVIRNSEQNLTVFRQVYEIGEIKITDLIAEQRRLLDANRDLTEVLTERYRAQVELLIALGAISFK